MSWPYFNLPSVKPWNNLKEPVAGYPASTWPLIASNARIDQTYGKKDILVLLDCLLLYILLNLTKWFPSIDHLKKIISFSFISNKDGINFGGSETKVPLNEGDTITRTEELGEADVKNRFDLGGFAGQVGLTSSNEYIILELVPILMVF